MSKVIVDGIRYLPMKRPTTIEPRPLNALLIDARKVRRDSLAGASRRIGMTKTHLWCLEKDAKGKKHGG